METQDAQHKQSNFSYSPKCQEKKMEKKAVYLQNKVVRTSLLHIDSGNHFRHCNMLLLHRDQVYSGPDLRIQGNNNSMQYRRHRVLRFRSLDSVIMKHLLEFLTGLNFQVNYFAFDIFTPFIVIHFPSYVKGNTIQ